MESWVISTKIFRSDFYDTIRLKLLPGVLRVRSLCLRSWRHFLKNVYIDFRNYSTEFLSSNTPTRTGLVCSLNFHLKTDWPVFSSLSKFLTLFIPYSLQEVKTLRFPVVLFLGSHRRSLMFLQGSIVGVF